MAINQCQGVKAGGDRCGAEAKPGQAFCRWHMPSAVQERVDEAHGIETIKTVPYPFHDGSVNENAAIRIIEMAKPNCPRESNPEISRKDGTSVPNPRYTGEESCERIYRINSQGRWEVDRCIELGHDPYYTYFRKNVIEEEVGEDGYVKESKVRVLKEKRLNVVHVSDNIRHSTGQEVNLAIARGCIPLEDFVCTCSLWPYKHKHEVPCEFRNCNKPQNIDTRYGKYCSERHARLIAADKQRKILPVGGDPYSNDQAMSEREEILGNLNIRKGA